MVNVRRGQKVVRVASSSSDSESDGGYGGPSQNQFIGRAMGGGKMLRPMPPAASDSDSSDGSGSDNNGPSNLGPSSSGGGGFVNRGRGKQLMVRRDPSDDEDTGGGNKSDASDSDDEPTNNYAPSFAGRGKMLANMYQPRRPAAPAPDPSSSEDEAPAPIIRRGGGKSLASMYRPPAPREDSDKSESDKSEDEEENRPLPVIRRGGGKSLASMYQPKTRRTDDDDSDDSDSEKEDKRVASASVVTQRPLGGGGKSLANMYQPKSRVADPSSSSSDDDNNVPQTTIVQRGGAGGKSLARMYQPRSRQPESEKEESDDDDDDPADDPTLAPQTIMPRRGGKMLQMMRPPKPESEDEKSEDEEEDPTPIAVAPKGSGKMLRDLYQPRSKSNIEQKEQVRIGGVGKQLRLPPKKSSDDEEMNVDDSDEDADMENSDSEDEKAKEEEKEKEKEKEKETPKMDTEKPEEPPPSAYEKATALETRASDDDESDDSDDDDDDEINHDALIENEEDQRYLNSLSEIKREAILAERFEKKKSEREMRKALREERRQERDKKAKSNGKDGKKEKESDKVVAVEDEAEAEAEEPRASELNRDTSGIKTQKATMKASIREETESEEEDDEEDLDFGSDDDDDDDDDDDSDFDGGDRKKKTPSKKSSLKPKSSSKAEEDQGDEEDVQDATESDHETDKVTGEKLADLDDFRKITIPRENLKKWCNEPYFRKAVINYFVRIGIGEDKETGKHCYRLCRVVDVTEYKSDYAFPKLRNESEVVVTNKLLKVKFGSAVKDWRMIYISDHRPSEDEVNKYISHVRSDRNRQQVITHKEAVKLRKLQKKTVCNYVYTKEDIEKSIEAKKRKRGVINIGMERTRVAIAVQAARQTLEEYKQELETLQKDKHSTDDQIRIAKDSIEQAQEALEEKLNEEKKVLNADSQRKKRTLQSDKVQTWVKVNERAKQNNMKANFNTYKDKAAKNAKAKAQGEKVFNPFARREVKPKVLWDVGMDNSPNSKGNKGDTPPALQDEMVPSASGKDTEKGKVVMDVLGAALAQKSSVMSHHQFAIDEENLAGGGGILGGSLDTVTNGKNSDKRGSFVRVRKGISLEEYLKRKEDGTL